MKKLMKGNEAIAEAAVQAGCKFFFGYPITPQNEIPEYMSRRLPEVGGCFLQAESEVSAINMVYGAGGAGGRVMTSSSSPGISLKQEGISYLVGAEVPCVIVNMMRCGPGLGGIQPAQSDYYQATRGGGHGDYRTCVLAPASVQEAVDLTQAAFDIADRYRNPVMVLGDGLIGQMMEPVEMDNGYRPAADLAEKTWAANGHAETPERPRSIINSLYIDPKVLERHCERLEGKYAQITKAECRWQEEMLEDAEIVLIAYGTTSRVARSAMRKCREQGIKVGLLRPITVWPFPTEAIRNTIPTAKEYLVVEMSAGQMVDDVRLAINGERPVHFYGRMGGIVPTVAEVAAEIAKYAPPVKPAAEATLEAVIAEKLEAVGGVVRGILKQAKQTIADTGIFETYTHVHVSTDEKAKEADSMLDERSFDEIEAKFKSALEQMKGKLKEASDKIQATSPADIQEKVLDAADQMAQKIREAALRVEQKLEEAGLTHAPEAEAPEADKPAAEAQAEPQPETAAEAAPEAAPAAAEPAATQSEACDLGDLDEDDEDEDDFDEDEDDDDEDDEDEEDFDEDDEEDDDDDDDDDDDGVKVFVETAASLAGSAAATADAAAKPQEPVSAPEEPIEAVEEPVAAPEEPAATPEEPAEEPDAKPADSLEEKLRSTAKKLDEAAEKLNEKLTHATGKLDEKLGQAADKLDTISADDIDETLQSAAQAVEDKLAEAGRKIEAFFNDPAVQTKAQENSQRFFDRAGKSIASGIGSLMKSFTRSGGAKQDAGSAQAKPEQPQDKGDDTF